MTLHERSSADHATGGPSGHVVGRLGTGEQLVLWALRQRLRDGEPALPALAAFEALFRGPGERAAGPDPWLQPGVRLKAVRLDPGRAAVRTRKGARDCSGLAGVLTHRASSSRSGFCRLLAPGR